MQRKSTTWQASRQVWREEHYDQNMYSLIKLAHNEVEPGNSVMIIQSVVKWRIPDGFDPVLGALLPAFTKQILLRFFGDDGRSFTNDVSISERCFSTESELFTEVYTKNSIIHM